MRSLLTLTAVAICLLPRPTLAEPEVTFEHDVMAVLSKAGCNSGACHGNFRGKGDLRLSLRGQDPMQDYLALVQDLAARRINRAEPSHSLLLQKPLALVPHQGGKRFDVGSLPESILRAWLRQGAPPPRLDAMGLSGLEVQPAGPLVQVDDRPIKLRVTAHFADGTRRDVTRLANYETSNFLAQVSDEGTVARRGAGETTILVRYLGEQLSLRIAFVDQDRLLPPTRPAAEYPVDQYINDKLARLGTGTAAPCDDATFLRRVSLDLTGRIPTAAEAKSFLENVRSDKRAQAIDRLLASPQFADYWALKWSDLLRVEEKLLDPQGVDTFHGWIRDAFAQAKPLDQFVRELITARGSTYAVPAANFYRAMRDPLTRGETVAQVFLGVRLQCAKCHNHPFDRWTQDDYYQWAALFARIDYEIVENNRPDRFDKHSFLGEQIVRIANKGEVINARTGREASPRLLGDATTTIDPQHDRLKQLAQWLASPENRPFARAQANRLWYHLMGRGLVEPIDDFRVTNPASHPQLLEYLTDELIRSQFDVRHVLRTIALSDAYQRSSRIKNADPLLTDNYAVTKPRRLTAEQLLDSQCQSLGTAAKFQGYEQQLRAVELPGIRRVRLRDATPSPDDRFLKTFGKPMRLLPCECERSDETTLNQALLLVSGRAFHRRLNDPNGRLAKWLADGLSDNSFVTQFYWSALTRAPTEAEQASFMAYIARTPNRLRAWQDVAWAVLNSKEFMFRF